MYKTIFMVMLPEIFLSCMACTVLLADAFWGKTKSIRSYYLSLLILICTIGLLLYNYKLPQLNVLENAFVIDKFSTLLKIFLCGLSIVVFVYSKDYIKERNLLCGEYFVLSLFSILGSMILLSSGNFLTLYLGLELLALPIYALLALNKGNPKGSEAAMKYFIMGALGSGLLLYGISFLYGISGTFEFNSIAFGALSEQASTRMVLYFSIVFILAGIGFKLGIVPFQMWIPDVYEGSITSLTLFIGTVTKIGAFALAYKVLTELFLVLTVDWQKLLMMMGILSVALGSIAGIVQANFKRMLAYSTIAHFGFIALGFSVANTMNFSAVTFYIIVYTLMPLGALGIMLLLSYKGFEAEKIKDLKGLVINSPWLAILMALFMLSMAGIPPTVGFYAKLLIIKDLIAAGMVELVIMALIFSVMAAFYYLRVIKIMFFSRAKEITVNYNEILKKWPGSVLLYLNGFAMLLLGVYPAPILYLCGQGFK